MNRYVLRWQYGLFNNDDKILFITIDKTEEIIKDTRTEKLIEYTKGE